ncbi:MAG: ribonuclease P protein component [Pseudomonadota bacterium]
MAANGFPPDPARPAGLPDGRDGEGARPLLCSLVRRPDYLAAARGKRWTTPGFIVQARRREAGGDAIRLGLTASRKVGNAVERNRVKRRLRALGREMLPDLAPAGYDIVLVGRAAALGLSYAQLRQDLVWALGRLGLDGEPK